MTTSPEPSEARREHRGVHPDGDRATGGQLLPGQGMEPHHPAALFYGYAAKQDSWAVAVVGVVAIAAFGWLDAFYLRQERLFRLLTSGPCVVDTDVELFSMDTERSWSTRRPAGCV